MYTYYNHTHYNCRYIGLARAPPKIDFHIIFPFFPLVPELFVAPSLRCGKEPIIITIRLVVDVVWRYNAFWSAHSHLYGSASSPCSNYDSSNAARSDDIHLSRHTIGANRTLSSTKLIFVGGCCCCCVCVRLHSGECNYGYDCCCCDTADTVCAEFMLCTMRFRYSRLPVEDVFASFVCGIGDNPVLKAYKNFMNEPNTLLNDDLSGRQWWLRIIHVWYVYQSGMNSFTHNRPQLIATVQVTLWLFFEKCGPLPWILEFEWDHLNWGAPLSLMGMDEKSRETAIYRVFQGNRMIRKIFIRAALIVATIRLNRMRSGHYSAILDVMLLRKWKFEHFHHHKQMLYYF